MAYKGLAAFEAEAEHNVSMKVNPSRRAAWTVAVNDAEQALCVDRHKRISLLADLHRPIPQKIVSSPKKQKRSYSRKIVKMSSVNTSAVSLDDASPPRKKCRIKSSVPVQQASGGLIGGDVSSSAAEYELKNTVYTESCSAAEEGSNSKILLSFIDGLRICDFLKVNSSEPVCLFVHTSIHPQKVSLILMTFGMCR